MNKKIITIAGIVFALIFVVILAVMMGTITNKANNANNKLTDTLEMSDGLDLASYDNTMMKGSSVVNAIKNGKGLGGQSKLWIYVETGEGDESIYGYGAKTGSSAMSNLKYTDGTTSFSKTVHKATTYTTYSESDPNADNYINEQAEFNSHVIKNENDVVVGIYFEQI